MRRAVVPNIAVLVGLLATACATNPPRADHVVSVYGGTARTFNSDIRLQQPGGTDLTVHDVSFRDESFENVIYYGFRFTRWNSPTSPHGWAIDFVHPKAIARQDDVTTITGTKNGQPVASPAPINSQLQRWRVSFGHNMLTANYMHRWFFKRCRDDTFEGRSRAYAGVGAGVAIPSPLVQVDGVRTVDYRIAGPALHAVSGFEYDLGGPFSMFLEGKMHWADLDIELKGGGSTTTQLWTASLAAGLSFRF